MTESKSISRYMTQAGLAAVRCLPPEMAHRVALMGIQMGLVRPVAAHDDPRLSMQVFGQTIPHPIGVAPGFDKNAVVAGKLFRLGAAHAEVGAVTPLPQSGNAKPRLFRLPEDQAVINRMGFNNDGLEKVRERLRALPEQPGLLGVNIGANADSQNREDDYDIVLRGLWDVADFFTINISSPNTKGLRDLQHEAAFAPLLERVAKTRDELAKATHAKPVLVKISPDLSDDAIDRIGKTVVGIGLDGIIATNTTVSRPDGLVSPNSQETGGLSGPPLFERSTEVLKQLRRTCGVDIILIGVGGVRTAEDAYAKIRSGASLVQIYTAMTHTGPCLLVDIPKRLSELLTQDGFQNVRDAIGVDVD